VNARARAARVRYHAAVTGPIAYIATALLALAASSTVAAAQPFPPPAPSAPSQLAAITGRDFAGLRLPGDVQSTDLSLAANRAWVWTEDDAVTPDLAGGGLVQRVLLQGDVTVIVAGHRFTAAQATIWTQQLPDAADAAPQAPALPGADPGAAVRTRQVTIFFDRVSDPAAEAGGANGFAQSGDRLLFTALVRGQTALRYDTLKKARPQEPATPTFKPDDPTRTAAAFNAESEQRFARHLRTLLGGEDETPSGPANRVERPDPRTARNIGDTYGPVQPIRPGLSRVYEPDSPLTLSLAESIRRVGTAATGLPPVETLEPIFSTTGIISFHAGANRALSPDAEQSPDRTPITFSAGKDGEEGTATIAGGVVFQYTDTRKNRNLQISAERAVIFFQPGGFTQLATFGADAVKGIFLEGDVVATDGRYTLRGPRVYYDILNQQAIMVDAVFWTYDPTRGLPLYVRAKEIRQLAANQWQASKARLTTTSFFDPVFSLGAKSVTITKRSEPTRGADRSAERARSRPAGRDGITIADDDASATVGEMTELGFGDTTVAAPGEPDGESTYLDARGITLRAADVPVFYLPRLRGEIDSVALQDIRIENSSRSGAAIKTGWDLFSSVGAKAPRGLRSTLLLDWYFDRGPAIGSKTNWRAPGSALGDDEGRLFAYTLPIDFGEDSLTSGGRIGRDHEFRGILLGDYSIKLSENWWLQLEVGHISDANFVDAFFRQLARQGREVTNAAYLKHEDDTNLLTFLAKGEFNDFTPNHYLLQSQGYNVDKLPEAAYYRVADDLLSQSAPGALVWSHEYRLGRMALNFTEPSARELGFNNATRARAAFGFANIDLSPADQLRVFGYTESSVLRADTRQELTGNFAVGPSDAFKISPFVTGRFTAYDDDFDRFRPIDSNYRDEKARYWYAGGVRTATQITRVDDTVESQIFDLHRTRHIIEPNATLWYGGTNLQQEQFPVYDDAVESISAGTVGNFAVNQTWQTQRGGPGRWRSVDVLKLNTGITGSTSDVDRESPIQRFFTYRPEYSQPGNFLNADAAWQVTDVVGLTFDSIYDIDLHQPSRTSAGGIIQHSPDFSSYAEARYVNALDATYVNFGCDYKLTRRYNFGFSTTYDTDLDEFQSYNFRLRRKVPEAQVGLAIGYDNIRGETSIGVIFEPAAADAGLNGIGGASAQRLRDIGR